MTVFCTILLYHDTESNGCLVGSISVCPCIDNQCFNFCELLVFSIFGDISQKFNVNPNLEHVHVSLVNFNS